MNGALLDAIDRAGGPRLIPEDLCRDRDVRIGVWQVWAVYTLMARYADVHAECWLSQLTIAELLGAHRRDVQRALGILEKAGLLARNGKRDRAVRWRFVLAELVDEDAPSAVRSAVRPAVRPAVRSAVQHAVHAQHNQDQDQDQQPGPRVNGHAKSVTAVDGDLAGWLTNKINAGYGRHVGTTRKVRDLCERFTAAGWTQERVYYSLCDAMPLDDTGMGDALVVKKLAVLADLAEAAVRPEPKPPQWSECERCTALTPLGVTMCDQCKAADPYLAVAARLTAVPS